MNRQIYNKGFRDGIIMGAVIVFALYTLALIVR